MEDYLCSNHKICILLISLRWISDNQVAHSILSAFAQQQLIVPAHQYVWDFVSVFWAALQLGSSTATECISACLFVRVFSAWQVLKFCWNLRISYQLTCSSQCISERKMRMMGISWHLIKLIKLETADPGRITKQHSLSFLE